MLKLVNIMYRNIQYSEGRKKSCSKFNLQVQKVTLLYECVFLDVHVKEVLIYTQNNTKRLILNKYTNYTQSLYTNIC